jgi:hypothetical protein
LGNPLPVGHWLFIRGFIMYQKSIRFARSLGFASVAALGLAAQASYATVDVTAITSVGTDVALVTAAIFGILVLVKGGKMVWKAL